ncbi:MAG: hydrogenase [Proteobacteria bacterium]|nr:hydrogenase [Pseudomonadota bacterium]
MNLFYMSFLILFSGGILALVGQRNFALMKMLSVVSLATGCLSGLIASAQALWQEKVFQFSFTYLNHFELSYKIDSLSAFFLVVIFLISMIAVIYSYHYMDHSENALATSVHYFFFSLLIISMALVVTADNIITFMLSWEIMSLSSFFLVIFDYGKAENRKAGYLYFIFSHIGAMFIFAAFGVVYGYTSQFGFNGMAGLPDTVKMIVFVLAFIGFGSKAGVFPFHVWLPHAHPAAPSHISAVMSGVMIKTGIYGILRVYSLLDYHVSVLGMIVLVAGVISGILGVVYALGQHDLKRLLAYSSVENVGIILIGIGIGMIGVATGNPLMAILGFSGGLLHVLNHSIFKSLLFMGAGMVLHKTGTRAIDRLGGLLKRMRITGATFLIGSLAISGLPPFNGFVGEFFIYLGAFNGTLFGNTAFVAGVLAVVSLAVIGGLALACFTKVMGVVFQGEPRSRAAADKDETGNTMLFAMMILASFCIIIGVLPGIFIQMTLKGLSSVSMGYGRIPLEPFIQMTENITLAAVVFLMVLLVLLAMRTLAYRGKPVGRKGTWGCGFTQPTPKMQYTGSSYSASIVEFFRPVAPFQEHHPPVEGRFPEKTIYHSRIDDIAERHMTTIIVRPVMWMFDRLRWIQHGDIHLYIGYIFLAIVVLLFFV